MEARPRRRQGARPFGRARQGKGREVRRELLSLSLPVRWELSGLEAKYLSASCRAVLSAWLQATSRSRRRATSVPRRPSGRRAEKEGMRSCLCGGHLTVNRQIHIIQDIARTLQSSAFSFLLATRDTALGTLCSLLVSRRSCCKLRDNLTLSCPLDAALHHLKRLPVHLAYDDLVNGASAAVRLAQLVERVLQPRRKVREPRALRGRVVACTWIGERTDQE